MEPADRVFPVNHLFQRQMVRSQHVFEVWISVLECNEQRFCRSDKLIYLRCRAPGIDTRSAYEFVEYDQIARSIAEVICPGEHGLNRAWVFRYDTDRSYIREFAHDFRGTVEPRKRFSTRACSLIGNHDHARFLKKMKHSIERIRAMNINLLRLWIKALEA